MDALPLVMLSLLPVLYTPMQAVFWYTRCMKHQHFALPNHSLAQAHLFFALSSDLNYPAEEVKRRAKLHYSLACFNMLTVTQMNELIEKLLLKLEEREQEYA